ncbi:MAG: PepSY domain-containing protein [Lagierella massiliensis]|nr:PepSY domain-containing protein [Lagierella massiliensis]
MKKYILSGLLLSSLFLVGCNQVDNTVEEPSTSKATVSTEEKTETTESTQSQATETQEATETIEEPNDAAKQHEEQYSYNDALSMFREQFPNSQIVSISYEFDEKYQYEVTGIEGNSKNQLKLDAKVGDYKFNSEDEDDLDKAIDDEYLDKISDMINRSLDDFAKEFNANNMLAKEWELEYDDQVLTFDVEVVLGNNSKEYKYNVVEDF